LPSRFIKKNQKTANVNSIPTSVAQLPVNHFYAAPPPSKRFDSAPEAPAPTLLYGIQLFENQKELTYYKCWGYLFNRFLYGTGKVLRIRIIFIWIRIHKIFVGF
jgi:hypothetical protein